MNTAEHYAIKLLTQREHSAFELRYKLRRKGYTDLEILMLLDKFKDEGWQNDLRFAEAYVYSRQSRGYGPLRIRKELCEKGVDEIIINKIIDEYAQEWIVLIARIAAKKFTFLADDFAIRSKQIRFLRYKGFSAWHIKEWLKKLEHENK